MCESVEQKCGHTNMHVTTLWKLVLATKVNIIYAMSLLDFVLEISLY